MAIGDIGLFQPAESAYARPGMYEESLRAEAVKRGTWLASLDQFYAQLAETQRQFDITAVYKEKALAAEVKASEAEMAYKYKALESEEAIWSRRLDIEERKANQLSGTNFLGRSGEEKALDLLKQMQQMGVPGTGRADTSWQIGGAGSGGTRFYDYTDGRLVPSTGVRPPSSGEVAWDLY